MKLLEFRTSSIYMDLPALLKNPQETVSQLKSADWVVLPGGFSYADHFGAGVLLAFRLKRIGFFERLKNFNVNIIGVCNGFQTLVNAEVFGPQLKLENNRGAFPHFINRWVKVKTSAAFGSLELDLPVRHGEGRLTGEWASGVEPFLSYSVFDNGSQQKIAGLYTPWGSARVWGLMPHPEIALWKAMHPNVLGPEYVLSKDPGGPRTQCLADGDGMILIKTLNDICKGNRGLQQ